MGEQYGCRSLCIDSLDGLFYTNKGRNLQVFSDFEDFLVGIDLVSDFQLGSYFASYAGAGAVLSQPASTALRPGIIRFQTGTTAAGRAGIYRGLILNNILFDGGIYTVETDIYINNLSTAIEEYAHYFGFGDLMTAEPIDGVYFKYDRTVNVNWLLCSASNSTRTFVDSGLAVAAGSWIRLKCIVYNGLKADYYLNGIYYGSIYTNIPVGVGRETSIINNMIKSVGTTNRYNDCDWIWFHYNLAVTR